MRPQRLDEAIEQTMLGLFAHLHAGPLGAHALHGAAHDLPARGRALAQDLRDVAVAAVEHLVQQIGRAFFGREPFEHGQQRDGQLRRQFGGLVGCRRLLTIGSGTKAGVMRARSELLQADETERA